jgi:hypothetical protein
MANANLPPPLVSSSSAPGATSDAGGGGPSAAGGSSSGVSIDVREGGGTILMAAVGLPKGAATVGAGFSFVLPQSVQSLARGSSVAPTLMDGSPLPTWLRFEPATMRFQATSVPDGAFPLQVMLVVGAQQVVVVISERTE